MFQGTERRERELLPIQLIGCLAGRGWEDSFFSRHLLCVKGFPLQRTDWRVVYCNVFVSCIYNFQTLSLISIFKRNIVLKVPMNSRQSVIHNAYFLHYVQQWYILKSVYSVNASLKNLHIISLSSAVLLSGIGTFVLNISSWSHAWNFFYHNIIHNVVK